MRISIKNLTVAVLALVAIAAWGLVIRQEIMLRRHPQPVLSDVLSSSKGPAAGTIPPGGTIKLPAPGSGPIEDLSSSEAKETPVIEILGTITDAETGRPVFADVQAGPASSGRSQVSLSQVSEFRIIFPATCPEQRPEPVEGPCRGGDETITIRVTAPGYQEWAVELKPHVVRSKRMEIPIELKPEPTGNQAQLSRSSARLGLSPHLACTHAPFSKHRA